MHQFLPTINRAAETWYVVVYQITWQATLLAVLSLAIVFLGRRWPSPLRYSLLLIALVKFALPPFMPLPTGVFSQVSPRIEVAAPEFSMAPRIHEFESTVVNEGGRLPTDVPEPIPLEQPSLVANPITTPARQLSTKSWLMLLHLAGFLVVTIWIVRSVMAISRLIRSARYPTVEIQQQFNQLARQFGLRNVPHLVISDEPCGPAAYGVARPVVILPRAVLSLDSSTLDLIMAHELAHHSRRDMLINWFQLALATVWWFNPVIWLLNREIRRLREDCCDDLLLSRKIATDRAYCDTLLTAASKITQQATAEVLLGFGDRLHPLGRRFRRIMDHTLFRSSRLSRTGLVLSILIAGVVLPGLRRSNAAMNPSTEKTPSPAAEVATDEKTDAQDAPSTVWAEGTIVEGRIFDHEGKPLAGAEVVLLGKERIVVDAATSQWSVVENQHFAPKSTRTDINGHFTLQRKWGAADRLGIITSNPLFWEVARSSLSKESDFEIYLPEAGRLVIQSDLPDKPAFLPIMIQSKSFSGPALCPDSVRFRPTNWNAMNPGEAHILRLAPGQYVVQRLEETDIGTGNKLLTPADRRLFQIESAKGTFVQFDRKAGVRISGHVSGLENIVLRFAYVTISQAGPEEILEYGGKLARMDCAMDVIPINADGAFQTSPLPPGTYTANLFAVMAQTEQLSKPMAEWDVPQFKGEMKFTVPESGEPPRIEVAAKKNGEPDFSKVTDLRLRVVDEDGNPVPDFEAMVYFAAGASSQWQQGHAGLVFLGRTSKFFDDPLGVALKAEGYGPTFFFFSRERNDKVRRGEEKATLKRGRKVEVQFHLPDGMKWPEDLIPETYFDEEQSQARMRRTSTASQTSPLPPFEMMNLQKIGAGRYEFWLNQDTPPFHIAIHRSGFLRFFEAGRFTMADFKNGRLDITLPKPASLDASFDPGNSQATECPFKNASLYAAWFFPDSSRMVLIGTKENATLSPRLKFADLAPGTYRVHVTTEPRDDLQLPSNSKLNPGRYSDQSIFELTSNDSKQILLQPTPLDPLAFRGDLTAHLRLMTTEGNPASGRNVNVTYSDGHYGLLPVYSGVIPDSGEIVVSRLKDKEHRQISTRKAYSVSIDDKFVGTFSLAKEPLVQHFTFTFTPDVGDKVPNVELKTLSTGKTIRLQDLQGKVVLLEFWAGWFFPGTNSLGDLDALVSQRKQDWNDRVVVIPVSVDTDHTAFERLNLQRLFPNLDIYWSGHDESASSSSSVARALGVNSLPTSMLIGTDGRIIWRGRKGDVGGVSLSKRIEDALKN